MLTAMVSEPGPPIADPLLRPDAGPRDPAGRPLWAPLGNSIRTLVAFAVLLLLGIGVWWLRRPADLTAELGGREWVITAVDGEPATNAAGTASTFVLDGTGEIRGVLACNVASGTWAYDRERSELAVDWTTQTDLICPGDWPRTYLATDGTVELDDGVLRVRGDAVVVDAIAPADRAPADSDQIAGSWVSGSHEIEIGPRGSFRIGACRGTWSRVDDASTVDVRFEELQRDDCELDERWRDEAPIRPVLHDGSLYLRRDRSRFPVDRDIVRLDPRP